MKISTGVAAMKMPDRPPMMNIDTKDSAFSIGTVKRIGPRHSVASQLNTFTPDGSAISIVETMKVMPIIGLMPDTNMWCPQTMKPSPMIAHMESTIAL